MTQKNHDVAALSPVPPDVSIHGVEGTYQEDNGTAIVAWSEPTSVEIIPGFQLASNMSFKERIKLMKMITEYTGAPSERVDEWLNTSIPCLGVVIHPCTVRSKREVIDEVTGEAYYPLLTAKRIVFKRANSEKTLAFVSEAVRSFVETFVLPVFGPGPWEEPINIKFRQVSTNNGGRTYQAQIVE
jgi:hypothetical protein